MSLDTYRAVSNHTYEVNDAAAIHPAWRKEDWSGPGWYVVADGPYYGMTGPFAEEDEAMAEAESQIENGDILHEELL